MLHYLFYTICAFLPLNVLACMEIRWAFYSYLRGSTEEYIVFLLKYNLWTRNDHRCKFILCTYFFLNKNMYIFIWGESSIKMSEPGEYCHTHTHKHTQKSHSELFAQETNSHGWPLNTRSGSGKPEPSFGWRGPDPLPWHQGGHGQPGVLMLLETQVFLIGTGMPRRGVRGK